MSTRQEILQEHFDLLESECGEAATWRRTAEQKTTPVTVVPGGIQYDLVGEDGTMTKVHRPAFLVKLSDLGFWPEEGQLIEFESGDIYRVIVDTRPAWTWHVPDYSLRVSVVQIKRQGL